MRMITNIEMIDRDRGMSRWACNACMVTDDKGNTFPVAYTHAELHKQELKLKLIRAGADVATLEEFEHTAYDSGRLAEYDANAGAEM